MWYESCDLAGIFQFELCSITLAGDLYASSFLFAPYGTCHLRLRRLCDGKCCDIAVRSRPTLVIQRQ